MASLPKSKKNSKSVNTATDTSSNKSLKGNGQASICPICCDVIVDATAGEDGHDSIFCDGALCGQKKNKQLINRFIVLIVD